MHVHSIRHTSLLSGTLILSSLLGLTWATDAQAQVFVSHRPAVNINDCTFVRDPTVLRDCLDLVEGQRLGPIIERSPPDPIVSPLLLRQAGADPLPGRRAQHRPTGSRAPVRPVAFDPVHVEQAQPQRRRAGAQ